MGVKLTELLTLRELEFKDLKGKTIAVDASNWIYQFLAVIRQPDGTPLTDAEGNITSHLMGLFTRNLKLVQLGINLVYIFDGKSPELKLVTQQKREAAKHKAAASYTQAVESKNVEGMRKYASMTSRLTPAMVQESKQLLTALGIPIVQAPSEAEAQAAFIVKQNDAFAIGSQDADSLLFGAPRTVRNLTFSGKRRTGAAKYVVVKPEMIDLKENLAHLGITQRQLITLSMLVGTDYNHGGIPGIGPKKALQLVKKYGTNFDEMFASVDWQAHFSYPWQEVFDTFMNIPIEKNYSWKPQNPDRRTILSLLIEKHGFSEERVLSLLDPYLEFCKKRQKGLGEFFG